MKPIRTAITVLAVLALTVPAMASDEPTVGSFVQRIAQFKDLDATDARMADDSLRGAGISLPSDLDLSARLTEGEVARIARSIGLDVSTNRPQNPFTNQQVDRFFETLQVEIALASGTREGVVPHENRTGGNFDPYAKGKGGRKGKKKGRPLPAEPE